MGGGEITRYYVSFQDFIDGGIIKIGDFNFNRSSGKVNIDIDITDKWKFKTSSSFVKSLRLSPEIGSGTALYSLQFMPPHYDLTAPNEEDGSPFNWNPFDDNPHGVWKSKESNPFYSLSNIELKLTTNRLITSSSLKYQISDWLFVEATYGLDGKWSAFNQFVDKTWLDKETSDYINGYISKYRSLILSETYKANLFSNNKFDDIILKTRLQYLAESDKFSSVSVTGSELVNRGVNNLENVLQKNLNVGESNRSEAARSISGILNIEYLDRYIVDGLLRFEQVSNYGPKARDRWFYRVSGAYRLGLDLDIDWIDELKLRGSYGIAGLRPPFNAQFEVVNVNNGNNTKQTLGNENLGPSVNKELEFGLDFNFFKKIRTSFAYAKANNENLVIPVPFPSATGFRERFENAASTESDIYEATLGFDLIKNENINWELNTAISKYSTVITDFNRSDFQVGPSKAFVLRKGEKYGTFYGKSFLTSLDQLPKGVDRKGFKIYKGIVVRNDSTDTPVFLKDKNGKDLIVPIGNTQPDFNVSLNTSFSYKNISLFALVDWQQGGDVYNQTKQWAFRELLHPEIDREKVGFASGVYAVNAVNDYFVEDGTFVKLREISLKYDLKEEWLTSTFIKKMSFTILGRNLITITNYSGADPEVSNIDGDSDGRFNDLSAYKFDAFGYPSVKSISGAVSITF